MGDARADYEAAKRAEDDAKREVEHLERLHSRAACEALDAPAGSDARKLFVAEREDIGRRLRLARAELRERQQATTAALARMRGVAGY